MEAGGGGECGRLRRPYFQKGNIWTPMGVGGGGGGQGEEGKERRGQGGT